MQAQLARENAALKAKLSAMQLSVAQAESANAASADTILRLQSEVASAIHLQRLAQGAEFMAVRKEARNLSVSPTCWTPARFQPDSPCHWEDSLDAHLLMKCVGVFRCWLLDCLFFCSLWGITSAPQLP